MADDERPSLQNALEKESADAERYVRTFATDAAAVQAGKVPGFTAEGGKKSPPQSAPAPVQAHLLAGGEAPEAAAPPLPKPAPPPPPLPPLPPSLIPETQRAAASAAEAPLRTYKSDFVDEVRAREASTADILAAESDRPRAAAAPPAARASDTRLMVGAGALILLGVLAAGGAYFYASRPAAIVLEPTPSTRIFIDDQAEVAGQGAVLAAAISRSLATPPGVNNVRELLLASSSSSIFAALALPAPAILLRNLESAGSLAGIVNAGGASSPFFILSVDSYADTFAGMLAWEPSMGHDLGALYPPYAATGTPAAFTDEVLLNHDVRALVDGAGRTILLYGYFDPNTLLIARDEPALALILDRLANSHTEQQ
jgi:hypothetical protein